MDDESLPRIAVIGAGPVGIEAALYGRYLGYPLTVFEKGQVAANVRARGQESMPHPFAENRSTLGLAALAAQDANYRPPADAEQLSCGEWAQRYLVPLAETDLIADTICPGTRVTAVVPTQVNVEEEDVEEEEDRNEGDGDDEEPASRTCFEITLESGSGRRCEKVEVVIDCSGISGQDPITDYPQLSAETPAGFLEVEGELPRLQPQQLIQPAPRLFILGAKSFPNPDRFSMKLGREQIRALFALLGEREELDVYRTLERR